MLPARTALPKIVYCIAVVSGTSAGATLLLSDRTEVGRLNRQ